MIPRSMPALAVAGCLVAGALAVSSPAPIAAQCLDRSACREIKADLSRVEPDLLAARREIHKLQRSLAALPLASGRRLAQESQLKEAKKGLRALKRELKALKQDLRHQGCASC